MAVLGAAPRLGRQDALDLDLGAAPGQADLVGQGGQVHDGAVGQGGQGGELARVEQAALVEEGRLGAGDHRPVRRTEGGLGRRRRAAGRRDRAEGDGARGGHGAYGSGRVGCAGS